MEEKSIGERLVSWPVRVKDYIGELQTEMRRVTCRRGSRFAATTGWLFWRSSLSPHILPWWTRWWPADRPDIPDVFESELGWCPWRTTTT
jgi:hypothetical protein